MRVRVVEAYEQPYPDPIRVAAGAFVEPDESRTTSIAGWVWCAAADGRAGWTPKAWLVQEAGRWHITRDFDALELTIRVGEALTVLEEESAFYRVRRDDGSEGWVPVGCVAAAGD